MIPGDSLVDADFSYRANATPVTLPETRAHHLLQPSSAVVNVTVSKWLSPIIGWSVEYEGGCYSLGDWTSHTNGVFSDFMTVPFYSTTAYNVGYHSSALNNWCGDNAVSKNATTNADFSVTVVEDAVTEDLTALDAVDANGNYLVYTSTLSINDVNVELKMYPNPADQFISIISSEVLSGVRVIDMTGKEVIRKSIQSNDYSLDLGNLNTGIYFLEATSKGVSKRMRFIKK